MRRYDIEVRKRAAGLIDSGYGERALANALAISASITEHWIYVYKAVGEEGFLDMGSKHRTYDQETKLAAVLDFLEGGLTKQEAMAKHAIASTSVFKHLVTAAAAGFCQRVCQVWREDAQNELVSFRECSLRMHTR